MAKVKLVPCKSRGQPRTKPKLSEAFWPLNRAMRKTTIYTEGPTITRPLKNRPIAPHGLATNKNQLISTAAGLPVGADIKDFLVNKSIMFSILCCLKQELGSFSFPWSSISCWCTSYMFAICCVYPFPFY